jgi:hypothetical protein
VERAVIEIVVAGGLGNQMFQYALGRHLSIVSMQDVVLNLDWFVAENTRAALNYRLGIFPIWPRIRRSFGEGREAALARRVRRRVERAPLVRRLRGVELFVERSLAFDPKVLELRTGAILQGYWQSERYFRGSEDVVRRDFTFPALSNPRDLEVAALTRSRPCVSVHVRRTDYITNKSAAAFHGLCGLDYYARALEHVSAGIPDLTRVFFSDDPQWVRESFQLAPHDVVVSWNQDETQYRDMQLMSLCQHHIIANSTFSWWGAWLDPSPTKRVVAPKQWFADLTVPTSDICPSSWTRL